MGLMLPSKLRYWIQIEQPYGRYLRPAGTGRVKPERFTFVIGPADGGNKIPPGPGRFCRRLQYEPRNACFFRRYEPKHPVGGKYAVETGAVNGIAFQGIPGIAALQLKD